LANAPRQHGRWADRRRADNRRAGRRRKDTGLHPLNALAAPLSACGCRARRPWSLPSLRSWRASGATASDSVEGPG